jgi:hypothetical protein
MRRADLCLGRKEMDGVLVGKPLEEGDNLKEESVDDRVILK